MFKTCDDLTRLWEMLDEGCSRSRMLNQILPSKENNYVLFTLYYTVLLKDHNSCLNPPEIVPFLKKYSLNVKVF